MTDETALRWAPALLVIALIVGAILGWVTAEWSLVPVH